MPVARTIRIRGQIQGVFFRETAARIATSLGVTGWVRNRRDGSVDVFAMADDTTLDKFTALLREGSPASQVDTMESTPANPTRLSGFSRRATV